MPGTGQVAAEGWTDATVVVAVRVNVFSTQENWQTQGLVPPVPHTVLSDVELCVVSKLPRIVGRAPAPPPPAAAVIVTLAS